MRSQESSPVLLELVAQGLVDAETAEALAGKEAARLRIGEVLAEARLLSVRQIMEILSLQADTDEHRRFGEIAMDMGLVREEDIAWAVRQQEAKTAHPLELLCCKGVVPERVLLRFLVTYVKRAEWRSSVREGTVRARSGELGESEEVEAA